LFHLFENISVWFWLSFKFCKLLKLCQSVWKPKCAAWWSLKIKIFVKNIELAPITIRVNQIRKLLVFNLIQGLKKCC
jgi:hypothetical protein